MRALLLGYFKNILFLLGIILLFPYITYAATSNNPAADMQFWIRLDARILVLPNNDTVIELKTGNISQKQNATVYIAECVDTPTDRICSTGTEEGDLVVYQSTENLKKMKDLFGYQFGGMTDPVKKTPIVNPVKSNNNGEIPTILLKSLMMVNVSRKFYGVNLIKGTIDVSKLPNLEKIHTGNEGGQQQAAFEVKVPTPMPKPVVLDQGAAPPSGPGCSDTGDDGLKCCSYNRADGCDPYGRVFDAISLEPIPHAKVTLTKQRADGNFTFMTSKETVNAIINPWMTKEDGKFVYLVPSGIYQLSVDLPNYIFPFISSSLNPNYTKAYYEIYYGPGFTDKNIVEINTVEHRDIPVIPKGEPYRASVKLLGYITELNKEKMIYEINGRASHPLTIIEVLGKKIDTSEVTRVLAKTTADKWGFFNTRINTSIFQPSETVGMVKMIKVDLTQNEQKVVSQKQSLSSFLLSLFNIFPRSSSFAEKEKPKTSQFTLAHLNPLLNYLEGYAYDSNNKAIPNAKVNIYLTGSKKSYYETKADENGHYTITSQHLPQMNYSIVYTATQGKQYSVTQTAFLTQNLTTILSKGINMSTYVTKLPPFHVSAQTRPPFSEGGEKPTAASSSLPQNNNSVPGIIIVMILIVMMAFLAVGVVLYRRYRSLARRGPGG